MFHRRRTQRQNSNIFEMLTKQQIVELREAFNLLDTNSDTVICKNDLETFNNSIGNPFTVAEIDEMMGESGEMSFMIFLTMIGERLSVTDDERTLNKAFREFSECGRIDEKELRYWLMHEGDKMNVKDVDKFLKGCVENGEVDLKNIISLIKHGEIINKDA
ncbi:hypothetical protein COBT_001500 [Conglomerata obtusa]